MSSERRTLAMVAQAIASHTPLSTLGLNVARGGVWCALSSILILIVSGSPAGHEGGGQAPGRAAVCGRNATLTLGVRKGVCRRRSGCHHGSVKAFSGRQIFRQQ